MNRPELLAPAGSLEGVRAAVQSGADAVYMGYGSYNARRAARGFTADEMAQAIAYCRARGVKTNLTLNILIGDRELEQALRDAKFLYECGADALIVQDLGVARALRRHAPDLALHASTQLTVHTLDGARAARDFGFSRVVLSRECTADAIAHITAHAGIETEVFVHGALCMCYSGQCYLSSVIGRRSGNRGMCAQPCRLPYNGAHPLSLKDLALADYVPDLCAMGVSSLKLEGRMKRPAYSAIVTEVYAKLVRERRGPTPDERDRLRRIFSRQGFTDGYYTGKHDKSMFGIKTSLPMDEVRDLYEQAERRCVPGYESPCVPVSMRFCASHEGGVTLEVKAARARALVYDKDAAPTPSAHEDKASPCGGGAGHTPAPEAHGCGCDGCAPQSEIVPAYEDKASLCGSGTGHTPAPEAHDDGCVHHAPAHQGCGCGATAQPSEPVAFVPYGYGDLCQAAVPAPTLQREVAPAPAPVYDTVCVTSEAEIARNAPTTAERVEQALRKTGGTPFLVQSLDLALDEGLRIPARTLNTLRRDALDALLAQRAAPPARVWHTPAPLPSAGTRPAFAGLTASVYTLEQAQALDELGLETIWVPLHVAAKTGRPACLPRVWAEREQAQVDALLAQAVARGTTRALLGNVGHLPLCARHGVAMYGDFGLNAFGTETLNALAQAGVVRQTLSFEARLAQIRDMIKHTAYPIQTELVVYGYLPLMIFENCAIKGQHKGKCMCERTQTVLTDRKGQSFTLMPEFGCRNTLLNTVPLWLDENTAALGVTTARLYFTTETPEACARVARAVLAGKAPVDNATRGLYHRGVE